MCMHINGYEKIPSTIFLDGRRQAAAQGLRVVDEIAFGGDYAETLRRWRHAFHARRAEVAALGFDTRFQRIWDFYLAYCAAGFDTGTTDVGQYTFVRI